MLPDLACQIETRLTSINLACICIIEFADLVSDLKHVLYARLSVSSWVNRCCWSNVAALLTCCRVMFIRCLVVDSVLIMLIHLAGARASTRRNVGNGKQREVRKLLPVGSIPGYCLASLLSLRNSSVISCDEWKLFWGRFDSCVSFASVTDTLELSSTCAVDLRLFPIIFSQCRSIFLSACDESRPTFVLWTLCEDNRQENDEIVTRNGHFSSKYLLCVVNIKKPNFSA